MTRTLLDDRFAPITWSPGFLKLPLRDVADAYVSWMRGIGRRNVRAEKVDGFAESLHRLEPLVSNGRPRVLLVEMDGGWTAYFDCGVNGTDPDSPIRHLSRTLRTWGLLTENVAPDNAGITGTASGRGGSVLFALLGPERSDFLNYVRSIQATYTEDRWHFHASGVEQPFEETEAYTARRIRDRFTSEMLERYCQALGIDIFNPAAYGPRCVLVSSELPPARPPAPPPPLTLSLADAQRRLQIKVHH